MPKKYKLVTVVSDRMMEDYFPDTDRENYIGKTGRLWGGDEKDYVLVDMTHICKHFRVLWYHKDDIRPATEKESDKFYLMRYKDA